MLIDSKDGVMFEVVSADSAAPPGTKGGLRLNTTCAWFRVVGGEWIRSKERSSLDTSIYITENLVIDIIANLGHD